MFILSLKVQIRASQLFFEHQTEDRKFADDQKKVQQGTFQIILISENLT